MNVDLKNLVELQQLDDTIRSLEAEIQSLPRKIAAIESQLTEHIASVEADKKKIADNQKSRRKREGDITVLREKISKHKDQMLEVRTNEQYRALQHEIDFHEAAIQKIEDEILTEMIESESLERQLRSSEKNLREERARADIEIRDARERKQQDEEKLKEARSQRQQVCSLLSEQIYSSYERISAARRGRAVAAVVNGACEACHVRLRPQAYNDVQANEQILNCESCGCILVYVAPPVAQ
ncbi:MAG: hypothetical protein HYX72_08655 [Acidobacteria bacterium]|nr:hypothetical protein [Acidobacteriota bacterium]